MSLFMPKGFTTLLFVLILSAVLTLLVTTASLGGIQETQNAFRHRQGRAVFAAANGCMEEALLSLNQNHAYTGETLVLNGVSCIVSITGSGTTRTLEVQAAQGNYARRLQATVDFSAAFTLTSWQELNP